VLQEIRIMQFEELYQQWTLSKLTIEQAASILGVNERTFRRWRDRYEADGTEGLFDRRLDRMAHNVAPVDEVMALASLYETRYRRYNVAHFYDKYLSDHGGRRSYTWVKKTLQHNGLVKCAKKRGAHRRKRERRPLKGMMLHQDGSTHQWVPGQYWDLIVTMDDADNEIYSAFFVEEEGTFSSFRGVREVIEDHGIFCSLYTDRGSHYWTTKTAGGKIDKGNLTQFGCCMSRLGIEMIPGYSPEARGRSERMFGTLQGRLPQELASSGITDMASANQFLKDVFLPRFNERFKAKPSEEITAFVPWASSLSLKEHLCLQTNRMVTKANTVSYRGNELQIERDKERFSYAKLKVTVREYDDGSLSIYHGQRCLGRYTADGELMVDNELQAAA